MKPATVTLSQYDAALLDKLDREAEAIETHLHGNGRVLLTPAERKNLREALDTRYARMASILNRYSGRAALEDTTHAE